MDTIKVVEEDTVLTKRFTRFCEESEIPVGAKKAGKLGETWVLVCNVKGKLFAVSNWCSHQKKPLQAGRVRGCAITCPVHGAKFDLETGEAKSLPASSPIETYSVKVVEGWIEVEV